MIYHNSHNYITSRKYTNLSIICNNMIFCHARHTNLTTVRHWSGMACCIPVRTYTCSWDSENPGIPGQGYGCVLLYAILGCTWDSPVLLGNPGILGQGYGCVLLYAIPECTWDSHGILENPGILWISQVQY